MKNIKKISLVGLTNVGKSTLFNKICRRSISIAFNGEDTTVDYVTHSVEDKLFVDTCGLKNQQSFNSLSGQYILQSDLILFVIDGRTPPKSMEIELAKYLTKQKKTIWLVCNKCESSSINLAEAKKIFFDKIFWISAEHSIGIEDILIAINLKTTVVKNNPLVAIVGRANSGKSTLMNCLLGYDRVKTEDKIGTTRDSIKETGETIHHTMDFLDTAGFRDDKEILDHITKKRREHSLKQITGAIIVLDGSVGLTKIDKYILNEIVQYASFMIVCINKTDILNDLPYLSFDYLNIPEHIPIIPICAKENRLNRLKSVIDMCYSNLFIKIPTNEINKAFNSIDISLRDTDNKILNVKYMFQKQNNPFIVGYIASKRLHENSEKFLQKFFANQYKIKGINIKFERVLKK